MKELMSFIVVFPDCLQIAALGFQGNGGESSVHVTEENIKRTLESLENPLQRVS